MGPCGLPTSCCRRISARSGATPARRARQTVPAGGCSPVSVQGRHSAHGAHGIVGYPLGHSISPSMHNAAFRAAGVDAVCVPMPAANADDFLEFAKTFTCAVPASRSIQGRFVSSVDAADQVSAGGRRQHAKQSPDEMAGRNTDVSGFTAPCAGAKRLRACVPRYGAGGAARGVRWLSSRPARK